MAFENPSDALAWVQENPVAARVEVEDPDCQRDSEDGRSRSDGQAERRAEDAGERSDT